MPVLIECMKRFYLIYREDIVLYITKQLQEKYGDKRRQSTEGLVFCILNRRHHKTVHNIAVGALYQDSSRHNWWGGPHSTDSPRHVCKVWELVIACIYNRKMDRESILEILIELHLILVLFTLRIWIISFLIFFSAEQSIISSNLDVLTSAGLGERGEQDFALVKETCHALLKIAIIKPKTDAPTAPNRYTHKVDFFIPQWMFKKFTLRED